MKILVNELIQKYNNILPYSADYTAKQILNLIISDLNILSEDSCNSVKTEECDKCHCYPNVIYSTPYGRLCINCLNKINSSNTYGY